MSLTLESVKPQYGIDPRKQYDIHEACELLDMSRTVLRQRAEDQNDPVPMYIKNGGKTRWLGSSLIVYKLYLDHQVTSQSPAFREFLAIAQQPDAA